MPSSSVSERRPQHIHDFVLTRPLPRVVSVRRCCSSYRGQRHFCDREEFLSSFMMESHLYDVIFITFVVSLDALSAYYSTLLLFEHCSVIVLLA